MNKTNFESVAVDDLFRCPGDRNSGTLGGHHDDVPIGSTLKKPDVAVMRKDFRPKLKIRCGFEDRCLRRVHHNGIGLMHEQIETAQSFNVARLLANTASFLENHLGERGKSSGGCATPLAKPAKHRAAAFRVRPLADFGFIASPAVSYFNLARVWRDLRLVRVGSCTQKTPAIGR